MDDAFPTTWLTDVNGVEIGVQPVDLPTGRQLRLTIPAQGIDRLLDERGAAKLLELLQMGLAFAEITDSVSFRVGHDEF